jgi:hypothetical protein
MRLKTILSATFGLLTVLLFSQESFIVSESDSIDYLTPEEYAMMIDRDDRFLIRADILSAGFEWEFAKNFSILAQAGFEAYNSSDGRADEFSKVEMRFYFPTDKFSRSSLNGPYISFGGELFTTFPAPPILNTSLLYLNLGLQRRFLGNGLADFGLRLGYQNEVFDDWRDGEYRGESSRQSYVIETNATVGLGLTFSQHEDLDYELLCPVLKCYDTERFLFKINVANAFRLDFGNQTLLADFNPSIAVEQKLGDLPFSVQGKANVDFRVVFDGREDSRYYDLNRTRLRVEVEGRYYYNLKSRMRKGKTGNSLSANYFALGYFDQNTWTEYANSDDIRLDILDGIFAKTGIQRTFGERLYFDVYLGAGLFEDNQDRRNVRGVGAIECGFKF